MRWRRLQALLYKGGKTCWDQIKALCKRFNPEDCLFRVTRRGYDRRTRYQWELVGEIDKDLKTKIKKAELYDLESETL